MRAVTTLVWIAAAVAAAVAWALLFMGSTTWFGAVAQASPTDWGKLVAGYFATVAGVVLGSAYRALRPKTAAAAARIDNFRVVADDIFRSRDLWAGLVASPLVFGLLYRTLDDAALSGLVVLALENGFCCHTVVSNIRVGKK
jgi:hypothetical protein